MLRGYRFLKEIMSRGTYSMRDGFQQNIYGVFVLIVGLLRIDYEPFQPLEKSRVVQVLEISLNPVVNEHQHAQLDRCDHVVVGETARNVPPFN